MVKKYIPQKGDFVWLNFDPQTGHEQQGVRTALVISNSLFNQKTGLCILCTTTTKDRGFPFHKEISSGLKVKGFVMTEQVKSLDYRARNIKFISKAPTDLLDDVLALIDAIIY